MHALEKTMDNEIEFFYSILYNNQNKPVLAAAFQLVTFIDKRNNKTQTILKHLTGGKVENDSLSLNILVCGNVFSDGENGLLWNEKISNEDAIEQVSIIANKIKKDKGIYGTASKKDLKELSEEGIDTQMIPWVDDTSN